MTRPSATPASRGALPDRMVYARAMWPIVGVSHPHGPSHGPRLGHATATSPESPDSGGIEPGLIPLWAP